MDLLLETDLACVKRLGCYAPQILGANVDENKMVGRATAVRPNRNQP